MDHSGNPFAALTSSSTKRRQAELSALRQQVQDSGDINRTLYASNLYADYRRRIIQ